MLLGYVIQDWQEFNIAVCGGERLDPRVPEMASNKVTAKRNWKPLGEFKRAGKPVHYPCVYYRAQWEGTLAFKERIILEHPQLSLDMFVGL
jgi:hypothetical protein